MEYMKVTKVTRCGKRYTSISKNLLVKMMRERERLLTDEQRNERKA
jgi:hypothetical protein